VVGVPRTAPPATVLVVDDEPGLRLLTRVTLEDDPDIEVVGEAGDGEAAITLVKRLRPDIVLLDVAMPVLDGLSALPEILRVSPQTRVVVVSGSDADRTSVAATAAGAAGYLQKGHTPEELVAAVRRVIRPRSAYR
jgi:DNA-binding NarL/FixJ family response regulator